MIGLIKTELLKLKRYSILWIGIAAMLAVVLLTRFMAIAQDSNAYTLEFFSNDVIWNNLTLIYPAVITLIAGYVMERERTDDTLKNLFAIPLSFRQLLIGKLFTVGIIAVFLAAAEFVFLLILFLISGFPGFSWEIAMKGLLQMVGINLLAYVAVLPIIIYTSQRAGRFMSGVAFSFFYGFVGTFASGHGLTSLYPVSAGLALIGYQGGGSIGTMNRRLSLSVLLLMGLLSGIMMFFSRDRVKKQRRLGVIVLLCCILPLSGCNSIYNALSGEAEKLLNTASDAVGETQKEAADQCAIQDV